MTFRNHVLAQLTCFALCAMVLAGCGKASQPLQPAPEPSGLDKAAADEVATQSASQFRSGPLTIANSLLLPLFGSRPAMAACAVRPRRVGVVQSDSTEFWYEIHADDAAGHELDWASAPTESIARLTMGWRWHLSTSDSGDSLLWHSEGTYSFSGMSSSSARLMVDASDQGRFAISAHTDPQWLVFDLASTTGIDRMAWEKSGGPAYPVSGTITSTWKGNWDYNDGQRREAGAIDTRSKLTLNGSRSADLLVDGRYHYTVDLETGEVGGLGAGAF